jgi:hypothetical protein
MRALALAVSMLVTVSALAAAPTITTFTPTSGPIGSAVVVKGTALTSPTAVKFDGTTATFTGSTATQLTATVPVTGTGPITVTTAGGTATSSGSFTVTPSALLSPTSGHPNIAVAVSGAGFAPFSPVDVYFDTADEALAVSNAMGVVSIQIQVPASSQSGTHYVSLVERVNPVAAQKPFTVSTNWLMDGFDSGNSGWNPYENTLNAANVAGLATAWGAAIAGYGANPAPMVEVNGNVYVGDLDGGIHAFNSAGKLLWHATESDTFQSVSPGAAAGMVFFGGGSSVYAFPVACRTDGGVCTPTWVTNIGTPVGGGTLTLVQGGITFFQNQLYIGGADGLIHPLAPATGKAGTPFSINGSTAPITTPVVFGVDGSYYFGAGNVVEAHLVTGSLVSSTFAAAVSPIALSSGRAFLSTSDGSVHRLFYWDVAQSGGGGCFPAPAVANNAVYAATCSTISAYQATNGNLLWSIAVGGEVSGLTIANGVLYGCVAQNVAAYAASNGQLLWSGDICNTPPIVANGVVIGGFSFAVESYSLASLHPAAVPDQPGQPQLSELKPDLKLPAQRTPD